MELGWGGFDRAKLDILILPFSFHVHVCIVLAAFYTTHNCDCCAYGFVLELLNCLLQWYMYARGAS